VPASGYWQQIQRSPQAIVLLTLIGMFISCIALFFKILASMISNIQWDFIMANFRRVLFGNNNISTFEPIYEISRTFKLKKR